MGDLVRLAADNKAAGANKAYADAYRALAEGRNQDVDRILDGFDEAVFESSNYFEHGVVSKHPEISIVVVSYRTSPTIPAALTCLAHQATETGAEVIFVNNGNPDLLTQASEALSGFKFVTPPFQVGCSGGRNLGARWAQGKYLVFLDDDGIAEPGCISSLVNCLKQTEAVAARGRVAPLTAGAPIPVHYDLGNIRIPALITCEGVSAWRRDEFLEYGGFHPVLAGHEGVELCAKMWPFFGPVAFLYEPSAVLRHDYAVDNVSDEIKRKKQDANRAFVVYKQPEAFNIHARTGKIVQTPREFYLAYKAMTPAPTAKPQPVSILTTAKNASEFLNDYVASWRRQLLPDSQIVFVDDCSSDDTFSKIKELFGDDERLTLLRSPAPGRGAALNAALDAAIHDICLISDVDDISLPSRISHTLKVFESDPNLDCFSFLLFQESNPFRAQRRQSPIIMDLGIEALFGMPLPFPAFTFRKSRFKKRFNESLRGGIDCDWIRRNIAENDLKGSLIRIPMVYYRKHSGQIKSLHNNVQKDVRKDLIFQEFERILGTPLTQVDRNFIEIFVDIKKTTPAQKNQLISWIMKVLKANEATGRHNPLLLSTALLDALDDVAAVSPPPPPKPVTPANVVAPVAKPTSSPGPATTRSTAVDRAHELRCLAEDHIRKREFKQARRILRQALELRPDELSIKLRILAASKYGLVRKIFKSRPYAEAVRK